MSDGRKRLSGYQYRKRKLEKDAEIQKQAGALDSFLKKSCHSNEPDETSKNTDIQKQTFESADSENIAPSHPIVSPGSSKINRDETLDSSGEATTSLENPVGPDTTLKKFENIVASDPATWPDSLGDSERVFLVNTGPPSPLYDYNFPFDDKGRRFTQQLYKRSLKNGEHVIRKWLVYSVTRDAAFCFCCKIFNVSSSSLATKDGYCNWQHISSVLQSHETSNHHLVAQKSWVEFCLLYTSRCV